MSNINMRPVLLSLLLTTLIVLATHFTRIQAVNSSSVDQSNHSIIDVAIIPETVNQSHNHSTTHSNIQSNLHSNNRSVSQSNNRTKHRLNHSEPFRIHNRTTISTNNHTLNQSISQTKPVHHAFQIKTVPELIEEFAPSHRHDPSIDSINQSDDQSIDHNKQTADQDNHSIEQSNPSLDVDNTSVNESASPHYQTINMHDNITATSIIYLPPPPSFNQSISQSVSQTDNVVASQPSNQTHNELINATSAVSSDPLEKLRADSLTFDLLEEHIIKSPLNQPIEQSIEPREKKNPIIELKDQVLKQIEEMKKEKQQSINQANSQHSSTASSNNQPTHPSNNQPNNQPSDQVISPPAAPVDETQPTDQSINQPIDQSVHVDTAHSNNAESLPTSATNQAINQAIDDQSSNQSIDEESINQIPHVYPSNDPVSLFHDRFNYAASDSGAKLLTSSKAIKKASSILTADDDRYLMVPCQSNDQSNHHELVIQLKEDIIIQSIELANFEHYSSSIREFELYGSNTYPANQCETINQSDDQNNQTNCDVNNQWTLLGVFHVPDSRSPIIFHLPSDQAVRYIKLRWINQSSNQYYCTLTYLKVYGVSVLEAFRADLDQSAAVLREVEQVVRGIGGKSVEQSTEQSNEYSDDQSNNQSINQSIDQTSSPEECVTDPPSVDQSIEPSAPNTFWDVFNSWNVVGQRSNQLECDSHGMNNQTNHHSNNPSHASNTSSSSGLSQSSINQSTNHSASNDNHTDHLEPSTNQSSSQSINPSNESASPLASASSFIFSQLARLSQQAGAESQAEAEAAANRIDPNFAAMLAKFTGRDRSDSPSKADQNSNVQADLSHTVDQTTNQTVLSTESNPKLAANQSIKLEKNASKESTSQSSSQSSRASINQSPSQSIFKTLTNRLNELEVHQALSTHFISDLSERFGRDIETIKRELIDQSTIHAKLIERSINQSIAIQHEIERVKSESDSVYALREQILTLQKDQQRMEQQMQLVSESVSQSINQVLLYQFIGAIILVLIYQSTTIIKLVIKGLLRVMTWLLCWRMRTRQRSRSTDQPKRIHRRSASEDARTPIRDQTIRQTTKQSNNYLVDPAIKQSNNQKMIRKADFVPTVKLENLKPDDSSFSASKGLNVVEDLTCQPIRLKKEEALTPDAAKEEQKAAIQLPSLERVVTPPVGGQRKHKLVADISSKLSEPIQGKSMHQTSNQSIGQSSSQSSKHLHTKHRNYSTSSTTPSPLFSSSNLASSSQAMAVTAQAVNRSKARRTTSPAISMNRQGVNSFEWLSSS